MKKQLKYKGVLFNHKYELKFAKWLDKKNIEWKYRPKSFKINYGIFIPDFWLPEKDSWVIIIKKWNKKQKANFYKFIKLYKSLTIETISSKELI